MDDFLPLLNPSGKASPRIGYDQVATERDFLQKAIVVPRLMVCGSRLCHWAKDFYRARGVEYETLNSPEDELLTLCPEMSATIAEEILHRLGQRFATLQRPLEIQMLLAVLFPSGPWQPIPSLHHAAEWLLWLSALKQEEIIQPLFKSQSLKWAMMDEQFASIYNADTPQKANALLASWLGIEAANRWNETFPAEVPAVWIQRARKVWRNRVLDEGIQFFDQIRSMSIPPPLVRTAAEVTADYLEANSDQLTSYSLTLLRGYLEPAHFSELEAFVPPPDPGSPPQSVEATLRWFTERYLPYRQWNFLRGDLTSQERGDTLAQEFAQWCLDFYPDALAGGGGSKHLAINQAGLLRENRHDRITLWVVLDGLNYADAISMARLIEEDPRLSRSNERVVIATLPTITCFSKNALIAGLPPDQVALLPSLPTDMTLLSENKDPDDVFTKAVRGDILVWRISEPDKSYHKPQDRNTLLQNVTGQLKTFADRLRAAVKTINNVHPLRVVISTDHGRLLGASQRKCAVPPGMTSEGRAAHGDNLDSPATYPMSGYEFREDGLVYLSKTRFRLPEDCVVVIGGDAFVMNDGSHGTVEFPHGGLYPEEVLTPWIEFVRDATIPVIEVLVSGEGDAGTSGTLKITLKNPGTFTLKVNRLTLRFGQVEVLLPLNETLEGMKKKEMDVTLEEWPVKSLATTAEGTIELETLAGKRIETNAVVAIDSNELYRSDFNADDLFNL